MTIREACIQAVRSFKERSGIDAPDENVIATVHLMNAHGLDQNAALDQSSRSANDNGIDAWNYDSKEKALFIYQSKLSDSKSIVGNGFADLERAHDWVTEVVVSGRVESVPSSNHSLFNLYTRLSEIRPELREVCFTLISPLPSGDVEGLDGFERCQSHLAGSELNALVRDRQGGCLTLSASEYELKRSIPRRIRKYAIHRIPDTRIQLRRDAYLEMAYLSLASLVQLHRERGDVLFDKNVRLSLHGNKEARERLVNPMESTLDEIVKGRLSPTIFAFYHIGITLSATTSELSGVAHINLEGPSVLNGCQTIVIADEFLKKLERQKAVEAIEIFEQIKVIAKIVVGTNSDELKEITNANNRQNPIENWQLFSNESIHNEIENSLKDIGVFYERQKGKFASVMKHTDTARHFFATNGTFVRVVDLAQIISLARQNTQWGAKPSEVFITKESHDKCFDKYSARNPRDVVFAWNVFKALRRGLKNYLDIPTQVNSSAPVIFNKPIVRAHVYGLGLLHFYQNKNKQEVRREFSRSLNKKANPKLVEETQAFYGRIVTRTRTWYTEESKQLTVEVPKRRMDVYFTALAVELGIDGAGASPFTERAIDWRAYEA